MSCLRSIATSSSLYSKQADKHLLSVCKHDGCIVFNFTSLILWLFTSLLLHSNLRALYTMTCSSSFCIVPSPSGNCSNKNYCLQVPIIAA